MALPSPIRATTGRSGSASCTPIAAGRPQPIPPPRSPKKLCGSSLRTSVRSPPLEEIDSSTTTASGGSASATALIAASDVIGVRCASARARARSSSTCRVLGRADRLEPLARLPAPGGGHPRLERREEIGERRLRVAEDRHAGRVVLSELPGIGVEVDHLEAGRHRIDVGRERQRQEVAADREQDVDLRQHLAHRGRQPERTPPGTAGATTGTTPCSPRPRRRPARREPPPPRRARRGRRCRPRRPRPGSTGAPRAPASRRPPPPPRGRRGSAAPRASARPARRRPPPGGRPPAATGRPGPVGGASAVFAARWTSRGRSSSRRTSADHFTNGRAIGGRSAQRIGSVTLKLWSCWPAVTRSGAPAFWAS